MTSDTCHLYIAIDRKRDDPNNTGKIALRQIIKDPEKDIEILKNKCRTVYPDKTFRIYRTVNKRSYLKAFKAFQHRILEDPDISRIDSLWKTCLLNPKCKAERFFLIDIDIDDPTPCTEWLRTRNIDIREYVKTPNGYHIVTPPFDPRGFDIPHVEIKKDALIFVSGVEKK